MGVRISQANLVLLSSGKKESALWDEYFQGTCIKNDRTTALSSQLNLKEKKDLDTSYDLLLAGGSLHDSGAAAALCGMRIGLDSRVKKWKLF